MVCEKQCSGGGQQCVSRAAAAVGDVCASAFDDAGATHLCVPAADEASAASTFSMRLSTVITRLTPRNGFANTPECIAAVRNLACFTLARECDPATNIELPICTDTCTIYKLQCDLSDAEEPCDTAEFRDTRDSTLCSGAAGNRSVPPQRRRLVLALSIVFSLLILLFIILWAVCCYTTGDWLWCCHGGRWRPTELDALAADRSTDGGDLPNGDDASDVGFLAATGPLSSGPPPPLHELAPSRWARFFRNPLRQHGPESVALAHLPSLQRDDSSSVRPPHPPCTPVALIHCFNSPNRFCCYNTRHLWCRGLPAVVLSSAVGECRRTACRRPSAAFPRARLAAAQQRHRGGRIRG